LGRQTLEDYWEEMAALRKSAAGWRPQKVALAPSTG
jgi:hypothetical protein